MLGGKFQTLQNRLGDGWRQFEVPKAGLLAGRKVLG